MGQTYSVESSEQPQSHSGQKYLLHVGHQLIMSASCSCSLWHTLQVVDVEVVVGSSMMLMRWLLLRSGRRTGGRRSFVGWAGRHGDAARPLVTSAVRPVRSNKSSISCLLFRLA